MCGVSGIISFDGNVQEADVARLNAGLRHRGPDFNRVFTSPGKYASLGHTRLSIVDLDERANQPFVDINSGLILVFNGEIYNFIELRQELISLGYRFSTSSDTEVVLRAYECWGDDCFSRFNGMWAIGIWNERESNLTLCRDRFGVKPLYFSVNGHRLVFASEQRAFGEYDAAFRQISRDLALSTILNPPAIEGMRDCLYESIQRVFPGEIIKCTAKGEVTYCKWWNTYSALTEDVRRACADNLAELFEASCHIRTRTDVDIALALSGGMDSSAVVSTLAQSRHLVDEKNLTAYIGCFPGSSLDESPYAELVADHFNLARHKVSVNETTLVSDLIDSSRAMEDISFSPALGQWNLYRNMKQQGFKVSIEGHGGDELLGGYPSHLNAHMGDILNQRDNPLELALSIKTLAEQRKHLGNQAIDLQGALLLSQTGYKRMQNRASHLLRFFGGEFKPQSLNIAELDLPDFSDKPLLFQKLYLDFHYLTLPSILRKFDRLSMAHGVEIRSPFLDVRFVNAAFSAPHHVKIKNGVTKALLREHMTHIPDQIRQRKDKSGFTAPVESWLQGPLNNWLNDAVNSSAFLQSSIFDGRMAKSAIEKMSASGNWSGVKGLWPLISLYLLSEGQR